MTVSKMRVSAVPAVSALERLLFSGECWSEEDFYTSLEDADRFFLTAMEGETLLGFAGLQQSFEQGDILTVAVDPQFRRRGVGTQLLAGLIEAFRQRGGNQLFLEVRASNTAARKLYERFGFQEIGLRRNYYQDPREDGVVYCLEVIA